MRARTALAAGAGVLLLVASFCAGAALSFGAYGEYLVMRHGDRCAAFDGAAGRVVAEWAPRNGRCFLETYLWRRWRERVGGML